MRVSRKQQHTDAHTYTSQSFGSIISSKCGAGPPPTILQHILSLRPRRLYNLRSAAVASGLQFLTLLAAKKGKSIFIIRALMFANHVSIFALLTLQTRLFSLFALFLFGFLDPFLFATVYMLMLCFVRRFLLEVLHLALDSLFSSLAASLPL